MAPPRPLWTAGLLIAIGSLACNDILGIRAPSEPPSQGGHGGVSATAGRGGTAAVGGRGATGGAGNSGSVVLVPNGDGYLDGTNAAGVVGHWYSFSDAVGCDSAGYAPCSHFVTPAVEGVLSSDPGGRGVCVAGSVAMVPNADAYSEVWGAKIALDLNHPDGAGGESQGIYPAAARGFSGLSFTITAVPSGGMRVSFSTATTGNDSPYWGGARFNASPVMAGRNVLHWPDVGGPSYVKTPSPFDPNQILAIHFHIITDLVSPHTFDLCINNLTLLRD